MSGSTSAGCTRVARDRHDVPLGKCPPPTFGLRAFALDFHLTKAGSPGDSRPQSPCDSPRPPSSGYEEEGEGEGGGGNEPALGSSEDEDRDAELYGLCS
ncbi:hypothetical protein FB107DRAFT_270040 [Schizophyllum commune]